MGLFFYLAVISLAGQYLCGDAIPTKENECEKAGGECLAMPHEVQRCHGLIDVKYSCGISGRVCCFQTDCVRLGGECIVIQDQCPLGTADAWQYSCNPSGDVAGKRCCLRETQCVREGGKCIVYPAPCPSGTTPAGQYSCNLPQGGYSGAHCCSHEGDVIPIVRQDNSGVVGAVFQHEFERDNGIIVAKPGASESAGQSNSQGFFSIPLEDGNLGNVTYVADEYGYQPQSDLVPAVPAHIVEMLELVAAQQAAGLTWDQDAQAWV